MPLIGKPGSHFWFSSNRAVGLHYLEYRRSEFDALPHVHGEYNITLCMDQSFRITRRGRVEAMERGDLIVINPGDLHFSSYGVEHSATKGLTLFVPRKELYGLLARMYPLVQWEDLDVRFSKKIHFPQGIDLARSLVYEMDRRPAGCELMVETGVTHFLICLLRECLEPELAPMQPLAAHLPSWQMVRVIEHMNARGKAQLRIAELCREIGSSLSHFVRLFTNSAGMSPAGYYNRLLIHKASVMLRHRCSNKEVAFALGFRNDSHFCTFFHRGSGITPGDFKVRDGLT